MRIAIGEFSHEANAFANTHADFARFAPGGWVEPETLLDEYRGTASFLGGMIDVAEARGVTLVPLPTIPDAACPILKQETFDYIITRICGHLSGQETVDGICFSLHGAGLADGMAETVEMATLRALRRVVGDETPLVATADLHGNVGHELLPLLQGLFCHKENPHVDSRTSGEEAMNTLIDLLEGKCRPQMSLCPLPLLLSVSKGNTFAEPMKGIKEYFAAYKREHRLIDAAFFQGFPASDSPDTRASVLVIADGYDPAGHAEHLARYVWSRRHEMIPHCLTPEQAIQTALDGRRDGFSVVNEASDNVGAGCPGDGTYTLRALLERDEPGSVFLNFFDPEVAGQAHQAGVGATISVRLGGKTDPAFGAPIVLDSVEVLATPAATEVPYTTPMHTGLSMPVGKTARLRRGNVEIVVVSVRKQCKDDSALTLTGAAVGDYRLVCLKSMNHFRSFFDPLADAIVASDPPGLSGDIRLYPYQNVVRPLFPLDMDTRFLDCN